MAGGGGLHNADTGLRLVCAGFQCVLIKDAVSAGNQDIALPDVSKNTGVPLLHPLDDIFDIAHYGVSGSNVAENTLFSNTFLRGFILPKKV
ncbi:hypothetical protein GCM10011362_19710 [Marinobacter halophilus]|nr:hypothetical protein GCM10011362_19710 [Marinobacter halophilus]